jgi:hypothetical protein
MNCSGGNLCFDIGNHVEASGVLENSTVVLVIQMLRLYWSMSEISGCYNPRSMIIQTQDFRTREAPPFMAGSSHHLIRIEQLEKYNRYSGGSR